MEWLNFQQQPLWMSLAIFAAAAVVVWIAGTRLSAYASAISDRTGIGKAFIGLVLLAGITSLPEVATSVTASATGNAGLAVNNLLGGVAMQVMVLVVVDAVIGRAALTSAVTAPTVLLQGTLSILLLTLVAAGITVGETPVIGIGLWSAGIMTGYMLTLWLLYHYQDRDVWVAKRTVRKRWRPKPEQAEDEYEDKSLGSLMGMTILVALAILVSGYLLTRTGETIAHRTGLGSSFVGAVLVAAATSLPEVSTAIAAARLRQYEMAVSDIFGGNLADIGLIFVVDAVYRGPPVLEEVGIFSSFGALLGICLTGIFIAGLIERRDRTLLGMGYDSVAALFVYGGGVLVLYGLRSSAGG